MSVRLLTGDCRALLPMLAPGSVHCVVTSPPTLPAASVYRGMTSSAELLGYLAGVIDSDGTIGIKRNTYSVRVVGDSTQPTFSERVCVKQVEPHAVDLLHATFGGYRFLSGPSAKRGRRLHAWQVTDRKAAHCLRALLPYLRIKQAQAKNCLMLREVKERSKRVRVAIGRGHIGAAVRPTALTDEMEAAYARARFLNRVGGGEATCR